MDMSQFSIPVSMLRQYCFCPRIPYFYLVRQLPAVEQPWVKIGLDEHKRQELLLKRRNLSRYGINGESNWKIFNNVELYSESLCMHGICDSVVQSSEGTFILEFKNSESVSSNLGARIQLAAYSMLYEQKYDCEIKKGFIIYGAKAKTFEVSIDSTIRTKVINTRNCIIESTSKGHIPSSSASENKCSQCEFFNFCSDRF